MTWLRHLLSIAILPFTMAVLIPLWIARSWGTDLALGSGVAELAIQFIGLALLALGLTFFSWSLRRFAVEGKGTLAPWDPPRELVVHGPYRYVRNPMISGVAMVLFGEAAILRSWPHVIWALIFTAINSSTSLWSRSRSLRPVSERAIASTAGTCRASSRGQRRGYRGGKASPKPSTRRTRRTRRN